MFSIERHLAENRNGQLLETPVGWVMFWRPDDKSIYIDDIGVFEQFRHMGFVVDLAGVVEEIARAEGRTTLYTNIHMCVPGASRMHDIVSEFGFDLFLQSEIINVYRKEIDGKST